MTVPIVSLKTNTGQAIQPDRWTVVRFPYTQESHDPLGMHDRLDPIGYEVRDWQREDRSGLIWPARDGWATLNALVQWEPGDYRELRDQFIRDPLNLADGADTTATGRPLPACSASPRRGPFSSAPVPRSRCGSHRTTPGPAPSPSPSSSCPSKKGPEMATPPNASKFAQLLRAEGLTVIEVGDWETHNRNTKGPWGPVNGVMIHHTVTRGSASTVALCRNGHSALPGPLCHGVITKDGRVHLVGYGRANHAGLGDPNVLAAVVAEKTLPADQQATVDGNRHFYGFECENLGDGKDPWPAVQLDAIEKVSAALARHHGWSERSVIGHLEWQPGKVDPRGFTMASMRERIRARLAGTTAPTNPTKPTVPAPPKPTRPVVDLSKLVAAAKSNPTAKGTPVTYTGVRTVETALVDAGMLAKPLSDGHYGTATVTAYAKWQRSKAGGSYTGKAADGIPGKASLERLGAKYGFTVTP